MASISATLKVVYDEKRRAFNSFLESWNRKSRRSFYFFFRTRWFAIGFIIAIGLPWLTRSIVVSVPLTHSTDASNHYMIAWAYVALAIAVVSLLFPLSLGIRDSLTGRAISLHDFLIDAKNNVGEDIKAQYESTLNRIASFRYQLFDKQLPFLVTFTAISVLRVLLCLIGIGFSPTDNFSLQIFEPQVYLLVYLAWTVWIGIVWQIHKPFESLETLELAARGRTDFESRAKPWLRVGRNTTDNPPAESKKAGLEGEDDSTAT